MPPSKLKLYISSTFKDLQEDRKILIDDLIVNYDVNYMERYPPAFSKSVLEKCTEDVKQADIYIGIIADKYGSIARDADGKFTELSYTEQEFNAASDAKKPILIFIKETDQEITDASLLAFINKAQRSGLAGRYKDPSRLSAMVQKSLTYEIQSSGKGEIHGSQDQPPEPKKKHYSEKLILLCNRHEQEQFVNNSIAQQEKQPVKSLVLWGHRYNGHGSFLERCAFLLNSNDEFERTAEIWMPTNGWIYSDEKRIGTYIDRWLSNTFYNKFQELTGDDYFRYLSEQQKNFLLVHIIFDSRKLAPHAAVCARGIRDYIERLNAGDNLMAGDKRVVFFASLQCVDPEENCFTDDYFTANLTIPALHKVDDDDVKAWMTLYLQERNVRQQDRILEDCFKAVDKDESGRYYMDDAQAGLRAIIEHYNKGK